MTHHFCTYFDKNFMARGIAMMRSLFEYFPNAMMWTLCLDEETFHEMDNHLFENRVVKISLKSIEREDIALAEAKQNRSLVEYYFTLQASLPYYVINHIEVIPRITYVDADLFFYRSPKPIFDEISNASIGIIEHRFPEGQEAMLKFGRFNVGWVTLRNNATGRDCARRWAEQTKEWCRDVPDKGRYAEQKYLDEWPDRYGASVKIIQNRGANVAPWNVDDWDGETPIFYHFSSIRRLTKHLYDPQLASLPSNAAWKLYREYLSLGVVGKTARKNWGFYWLRVLGRLLTGRLIYVR